MDNRILRVIAMLNEYPRYEAGLDHLAQSVNLSPSRVRHLFKVETGLTLVQYKQNLKMQRTRDLLENTFLRVKEITNILGVGSESYFVRTFKKRCGCAPAQYRTAHLRRTYLQITGVARSGNE